MATEAKAEITVRCDNCGALHVGAYSHDGGYTMRQPVYAVVCTKDNLTDYYYDEADVKHAD